MNSVQTCKCGQAINRGESGDQCWACIDAYFASLPPEHYGYGPCSECGRAIETGDTGDVCQTCYKLHVILNSVDVPIGWDSV